MAETNQLRSCSGAVSYEQRLEAEICNHWKARAEMIHPSLPLRLLPFCTSSCSADCGSSTADLHRLGQIDNRTSDHFMWISDERTRSCSPFAIALCAEEFESEFHYLMMSNYWPFSYRLCCWRSMSCFSYHRICGILREGLAAEWENCFWLRTDWYRAESDFKWTRHWLQGSSLGSNSLKRDSFDLKLIDRRSLILGSSFYLHQQSFL